MFAHWVTETADGAELHSEGRVAPVDTHARVRLKAIWTVLGPFERLVGVSRSSWRCAGPSKQPRIRPGMERESARAGLGDSVWIEVARRLLAEAGGEALDRLAALSARLLGAAYAQVALITDKVAPVTPIAPAQPRAEELIHQIADLGMPIVLSNARVDGIGAFIGVPVDAAGARVGVLSVYDREPPNSWTDHDVEIVPRELAGTVAVELERRVLAAELQTSTVRLDLGFAAADIGSFDWNLVTNALHWDDRLMELFGYEERDVRAAHRLVLGPPAPRRPRAHRGGDRPRDRRLRRLRGPLPRRAPRRGRALGRRPRPRALRPGRAAGADARRRLRHDRRSTVPPSASAACWNNDEHGLSMLDRDYRFTYLNAEAERLMGRRRDELIGEVIWEAYGDLGGTPSGINYRDAMESGGELRSFEHYYPPLDAHFDVRATPQRRRAERLLPRHLQSSAGRARTRGGAGGDRRGHRPPADPQRGPARGWRARWRSTSCCRSSATSCSTGSAKPLGRRARRA